MGVLERRVRIYVCDRCGDDREAEGNQPPPAGWRALVRGQGTLIGIENNCVTDPLTLLCSECNAWLTKFLSGCKVSD